MMDTRCILHGSEMLMILVLVFMANAVAQYQETCGYYNVTDALGILESSPRLMCVRPVTDWKVPTNVTVDVIIRAVLEMNEKLQTVTSLMDLEMIWVNQLLTWDPQDFCGISRISIPEGSVWIPDIYISEMYDNEGTEEDSVDVTYLYLYNDGKIWRMKTIKVVISCPLDIYKFPLDTQKCHVTFGTRTNPVVDVIMLPGLTAENITTLSMEDFMRGEWNLIKVDIILSNVSKHGEEWSKVMYEFVIKRAPIMYIINLIIPACLLVLVDVASMFIPMEGGERLGFKITIVLGFSVLLLILNDFLPSTYNPPILGVFCMVCLIIMIFSIIDSIFISYMLHLSAIRPNVPQWLKVWVLARLALVLRINTKLEIENLSAENKVMNEELSSMPDKETHINNYSSKDSTDSTETKLLKKLLQELVMIRRHLKVTQKEEEAKSEWHMVAIVLDRFILILYLIIVVFIMATVVVVWIV